MMNLNKKLVVVRMDNEMGEFVGIDNKLPKGYTPKIKIRIEGEKTHINGKNYQHNVFISYSLVPFQ